MPARAFALMMLNGSLDDSVMIPALDAFVEAGYQGVCLHPRDGLLVPYASVPYWERIDRIVGLARERGLDIWFYDEFPYPSGCAGGIVPARFPAGRSQTLRFLPIETARDSAGLIDIGAGNLLALLRYRQDKSGAITDIRDVTDRTGPHMATWVWGNWHNRFYTGAMRVHEERHERASADRFTNVYLPGEDLGDDRLLAIKIETEIGQKKQPGKPDILLPEITDFFLEKTYGVFAQLQEKHGIDQAPVFQDEVTFYSYFPWNREVERRLRPLWGDKLTANLLAMYLPRMEGWEYLRYQYRAACQEAIEENWYVKVSRYCHEHGLRMTGHLPGEETFFGHCQILGDIFKNLRHFDIPGYDIITSYTTDDENRCQAQGIKSVQSVAWIEGRKPTMAEVFGAFGYHCDLQKCRTALGWLALHDITRVTNHAAWTCTLGVRKYDAPPIHNRFDPLSVGYGDLWGWHTWFAELLQGYSFDPEVLALLPVDSLARYQTNEVETWGEETSLLETFYHYLNAHTQDNISMPSHLLAEIELVPEGFHFRDHVFRKFIVPPIHSMHETTWNELARLAGHPGFSWVLPRGESQVIVFGPNFPQGERRTVQAQQVASCDEAELVAAKAPWFDALLDSRLRHITAAVTIVKSLRRSKTRGGESLLTVMNPNEHAVDVRLASHPGAALAQPPHGVGLAPERDGDGWRLRLAPKEIRLFVQHAGQAKDEVVTAGSEINATSASLRFAGVNHHSLKVGTASAPGREIVPFKPAPVSSLWQLDVEYYKESQAIYADPFSLDNLPEPVALEVSFSVTLETALTELDVAIDAESLPPGATASWDGTALKSEIRDLYEQGNTVFPIPAKLLTPGAHTLTFAGNATSAAHGVAERPILVGRFLVAGDEPLTLKAMPEAAQPLSAMKLWPELGMPEGYGPVDYEFAFTVPAGEGYELRLPEFMGVAEISVDGKPAGRSSWAPHVVPLPALATGAHTLTVRVHGSWNNIFSSMNRLANGLSAAPVMVKR